MADQRHGPWRTTLWVVVFAAAFCFVLTASMRTPGPAAPRAARTVPLASAPPSGGSQTTTAPTAATDDAAATAQSAAAWGQFTGQPDIMVRAEDVKELRGLMTLNEGPDNPDVRVSSGQPPTVRYVWCEDDGVRDREPDAAAPQPPAEHVAAFTFDVPEAGTYYPWARVWWQDSCGNSLILVIQPAGRAPSEYVVQEGAKQWWQWLPVVGTEGVQLPKGPCRMLMRNREDGARLSRVLFSERTYAVHKPETPEG